MSLEQCRQMPVPASSQDDVGIVQLTMISQAQVTANRNARHGLVE